jgi:hypothetical protein
MDSEATTTMMTFAQVACVLTLLVGQAKLGAQAVPDPWQPPKGFVEETPTPDPSVLNASFASERVWTRQSDGWIQQIVEVRTKKRLSLPRFLAIWRASHACALSPMRGAKPLSWAGNNQSSWSGSCEGGDVFVMHVAQVGDTFFAFHVGQRMGPQRLRSSDAFREALGRMLEEAPKPRAAVDAHPKSGR